MDGVGLEFPLEDQPDEDITMDFVPLLDQVVVTDGIENEVEQHNLDSDGPEEEDLVDEVHSDEYFSDPRPTDADNSIVLSDLLRTGEASRLRRRGAVAVRVNEREHLYLPSAPALPTRDTFLNVVHGHNIARDSDLQEDSTTATRTIPALVDEKLDPSKEYMYILFCGNIHLPMSSSSYKGKEKADGAQEWGCGALIHTHVSPRPHPQSTLWEPYGIISQSRPYTVDPGQGESPGQRRTEGQLSRAVWTARTDCVEGTVARLEQKYFTSVGHEEDLAAEMGGARSRFIHPNRKGHLGTSDCGCIREGIGCAVCGNLLGTRYIPCRAAAEAYVRPRISQRPSMAQLHADEIDNMINAPEGRPYWGSLDGDLRPEPFPPRSFLTPSSSYPKPSSSLGEQDRLVLCTFFSDPVTSSDPAYDFVRGLPISAPTPQSLPFSQYQDQNSLEDAPAPASLRPPPRAETIHHSSISLEEERMSQSPDITINTASPVVSPTPSGETTTLEHMPPAPRPPSVESAAAADQLVSATGPAPQSSIGIELETSSEEDRWARVRSAARERVRARARARGYEQEALDQAQASGEEHEIEQGQELTASAHLSSSLPVPLNSISTEAIDALATDAASTIPDLVSTTGSAPSADMGIAPAADTETSGGFEDISLSGTSPVRTASPRLPTPRLIGEEIDNPLPPTPQMGTTNFLPTPSPGTLSESSDGRIAGPHPPNPTVRYELYAEFTSDEDAFIAEIGPHSAPLHRRRRRRTNGLRRGQRQRFDPDGENLSSVSGSDGEGGDNDYISSYHISFMDPAYANRYRERLMRAESVFPGNDTLIPLEHPSNMFSSDDDSDSSLSIYGSGQVASGNNPLENTDVTNIWNRLAPARAFLAGGDFDDDDVVNFPDDEDFLDGMPRMRALPDGSLVPRNLNLNVPTMDLYEDGTTSRVSIPGHSNRQLDVGGPSSTNAPRPPLQPLPMPGSSLTLGNNTDSPLTIRGRQVLAREEESRALAPGESLPPLRASHRGFVAGLGRGERRPLRTSRSFTDLLDTQSGTEDAEEYLRRLRGRLVNIREMNTRLAISGRDWALGRMEGVNGDNLGGESPAGVAAAGGGRGEGIMAVEAGPAVHATHEIRERGLRRTQDFLQNGPSAEQSSASINNISQSNLASLDASGNGELITAEIRNAAANTTSRANSSSASLEIMRELAGLHNRLIGIADQLATRQGQTGNVGEDRRINQQDSWTVEREESRRQFPSMNQQLEELREQVLDGRIGEVESTGRHSAADSMREVRSRLTDMITLLSARGGVRSAEARSEGGNVEESPSPRLRGPLRRAAIRPSRGLGSTGVVQGYDNGIFTSEPIVDSPEPMVISVSPSVSPPSVSGSNPVAIAGPPVPLPSSVSPPPRSELSLRPRGDWYGGPVMFRSTVSDAYVQRLTQNAMRRQRVEHDAGQVQPLQGVPADMDSAARQGQILSRGHGRERERRDNVNLRARASARAVLRARAGMLDPDGERFVYDERYGVEGDEIEPGLDLDGVRHEGTDEGISTRIRDVWESIVFRDG